MDGLMHHDFNLAVSIILVTTVLHSHMFLQAADDADSKPC